MSNVSEKLEKIVQSAGKQMKLHNFKRNKIIFKKNNSETISLLSFQKSQDNNYDYCKFTINIGVIIKKFVDLDDDINKMSVWDAHLRQRIGFIMPEKIDTWWELSPETNELEMSSMIDRIIETYAIPYLEKYSNEKNIIKLWISGNSPGINEYKRDMYLKILH